MTGVLFGRTLPSTFQFIYDKHDSRPRDPFDVKWEVPFGESIIGVAACAPNGFIEYLRFVTHPSLRLSPWIPSPPRMMEWTACELYLVAPPYRLTSVGGCTESARLRGYGGRIAWLSFMFTARKLSFQVLACKAELCESLTGHSSLPLVKGLTPYLQNEKCKVQRDADSTVRYSGHCVNGVAVQFDNRSVLGFQLQVPNAEAQRWLGRRERGHLLNFTAPSPDHVLQGVDACRTGNTLCGLNFDFAHGCPRPSDSAIQCCHGACQSVLYPAAGFDGALVPGRWKFSGCAEVHCPDGYSTCMGDCVDTDFHESHCGECGHQCIFPFLQCYRGRCVDATNFHPWVRTAGHATGLVLLLVAVVPCCCIGPLVVVIGCYVQQRSRAERARLLQQRQPLEPFDPPAAAEDLELCCICTENVSNMTLSCGHLYCQPCLQDWARSHREYSCPQCREPIINQEVYAII